jgi:NAD(P)H-hydrate epimerase
MTPTPAFTVGLTSAQVAEVDRLAEARFGIPVEWLMEAAGWQVARSCRGLTAVLCGPGSNGGDGLAAARHLHRWGLLHSVSALDRAGLRGAAAGQADALEAAGVEIRSLPAIDGAELVLDALFGSGLNRPPGGVAADWIDRVNGSGLRVAAVDLPSGLGCDDGRAYEPAIRADLTFTLGLPKAGLLMADGPRLAGEIWVVDIGIPPQAYAMVGAVMPEQLFKEADRIRLPVPPR